MQLIQQQQQQQLQQQQQQQPQPQQPYPFTQPTFSLSNQFQYSPYSQAFYPTYFASQNNPNSTNNNPNNSNNTSNNSNNIIVNTNANNDNNTSHTMNGIPFTYATLQSTSSGPKPTGMFLNQPTPDNTTTQQQPQQQPTIQTTTSAPTVMSRGQSAAAAAAAAAQKKRPRSLAEETEELKVELKKLLDLLHEKGWKRDANGNFYNDEVDFDSDDKTSGNPRLLDFATGEASSNHVNTGPSDNLDINDPSTNMNTSNLWKHTHTHTDFGCWPSLLSLSLILIETYDRL